MLAKWLPLVLLWMTTLISFLHWRRLLLLLLLSFLYLVLRTAAIPSATSNDDALQTLLLIALDFIFAIKPLRRYFSATRGSIIISLAL